MQSGALRCNQEHSDSRSPARAYSPVVSCCVAPVYTDTSESGLLERSIEVRVVLCVTAIASTLAASASIPSPESFLTRWLYLNTPVGRESAAVSTCTLLDELVVFEHTDKHRVAPGQSVVIRGHQRSSKVIRGNQRSSKVIRGHQRSSEVIRGHQRSSEIIRDHHRSSPASSRAAPEPSVEP